MMISCKNLPNLYPGDSDRILMQCGETVHHYTSIEVLKEILKTGKMWARCSSKMNDTTDTVYFINCLESALKDDLKGDPLKRCEEFFRKLRLRLNEEYPYIISFSKNYDEISQWTRYGRNQKGVCISFDTLSLANQWNFGTTDFLCIMPVFYDLEIRDHDHYKYLKRYFINNEIPNGYLHNEKGMMDNILGCAYIIKNPGVASENEVRFTTFWGGIPSNGELITREFKGISQDILVLSLITDSHSTIEDIVTKITVGSNSEESVEELSNYIKNKLELEELSRRVVKSTCPILPENIE